MMVRLKVCGMKYPDNVKALLALQPDYMGFIFYEQSKRFVGDLNPEITHSLPQGTKPTGVFVNEKLENVISIVQKYQLKAVQLHGAESPEYCARLKSMLPEIELIKAFGVNETFDFEILAHYEKHIDYFLFDTQTEDHGGSGKTFNWQLLENYRLHKPYFLSGGIGLEQAGKIAEIMDPRLYAIDLNSRFESSAAEKNIEQLTTFKNQLLSMAQ